ncbi:MAG: hypothetical protein KBD63_02080 [Bacteriovoracaceae bacterium]|nr:hypothetical protein [Bacteriovoracaceae bacterium]
MKKFLLILSIISCYSFLVFAEDTEPERTGTFEERQREIATKEVIDYINASNGKPKKAWLSKSCLACVINGEPNVTMIVDAIIIELKSKGFQGRSWAEVENYWNTGPIALTANDL